MSDSPRRLPARPSLEQLRKQSKEHLRALRVEDSKARLTDAQYSLAKQYGFASWPKLVRHVDALNSSEVEVSGDEVRVRYEP